MKNATRFLYGILGLFVFYGSCFSFSVRVTIVVFLVASVGLSFYFTQVSEHAIGEVNKGLNTLKQNRQTNQEGGIYDYEKSGKTKAHSARNCRSYLPCIYYVLASELDGHNRIFKLKQDNSDTGRDKSLSDGRQSAEVRD